MGTEKGKHRHLVQWIAASLIGFSCFVAVGVAAYWYVLPGRAESAVTYGWLDWMERQTYDWRMQWRTSPMQPAPVAAVCIDEESLNDRTGLGQWPWPRDYHGLIVEACSRAGAAAVAFDVVFFEKSSAQTIDLLGLQIERIAERAKETGEDEAVTKVRVETMQECRDRLSMPDAIFGQEMERSGKVFLPGEFIEGTQARGTGTGVQVAMPADVAAAFGWRTAAAPPDAVAATQAHLPIAELLGKAAGLVSINTPPDPDGVTRRVPLFVKVGDVVVPSLSLALWCTAMGVKPEGVAPGKWCVELTSGTGSASGRAIRIPTDGAGNLLVNYIGTWSGTIGSRSPITHVSAGDLINSFGQCKAMELNLPRMREQREALAKQAEDGAAATDEARAQVKARLAELDKEIASMEEKRSVLEREFLDQYRGKLQGRQVIVGLTAVGTSDFGPVPTDNNLPLVSVHLCALRAMHAGEYVRRLPPAWGMGILLACGLCIAPFLASARPLWGSLVVAAGIPVAFLLGLWLLSSRGLWVDVTPLCMSGPVALGAVTAWKHATEEREKRKVRGMFSTMVSGDVLAYLEENPEAFSLSGEKREATMFFSDVAGFTTISESLTPENLVKVLNRYLTPMTDIIMASGGYVDKYEGDAIMAVWGVPRPQPDHAVRACWAALDQQKHLQELRVRIKAEFNVTVNVRMGLNSGSVSAGNMGSDKRFSYTVMGDAVNQADRFEPANKDYNTLIMIGATTYALAKEKIEARLVDKLVVKGKSIPIDVYELMAKKGELPADMMKVRDLFTRGVELHWERKWDEALDCLRQALAIKPDDGPCHTYVERIEDYKVTPPPQAWRGEYVRKGKD